MLLCCESLHRSGSEELMWMRIDRLCSLRPAISLEWKLKAIGFKICTIWTHFSHLCHSFTFDVAARSSQLTRWTNWWHSTSSRSLCVYEVERLFVNRVFSHWNAGSLVSDDGFEAFTSCRLHVTSSSVRWTHRTAKWWAWISRAAVVERHWTWSDWLTWVATRNTRLARIAGCHARFKTLQILIWCVARFKRRTLWCTRITALLVLVRRVARHRAVVGRRFTPIKVIFGRRRAKLIVTTRKLAVLRLLKVVKLSIRWEVILAWIAVEELGFALIAVEELGFALIAVEICGLLSNKNENFTSFNLPHDADKKWRNLRASQI